MWTELCECRSELGLYPIIEVALDNIILSTLTRMRKGGGEGKILCGATVPSIHHGEGQEMITLL